MEDRERSGDKENRQRPGRSSQLFFWILIITAVALLVSVFYRSPSRFSKPLDYESVLEDVRSGRVKEVKVIKQALEPAKLEVVYTKPEDKVLQFKSPTDDYVTRLYWAVQEANADTGPGGVRVRYTVSKPPFSFSDIIPYLPGILLLVIFFVFLSRLVRMPGAGGNVLSFGKSRARLVTKEKCKVTFDDVAGIDEALEEVKEIVEFLKNPAKFQRLGGRVPRGVVLVGPPGTGKTLLAKAIAGEADVPFFSISGSDFVEMFVGVGASRVRDLFKQARENSPCIVFLDEIDAVGRRRGTGLGGGHDEREQTLNSILVEMDGFDSDEGIIVIAATNRPDVLDPALLRPGRFDREIVIDLPDVRGREAILKVHAKKVPLGSDVDLGKLARATPTFSGAELAALINEAAIQAAMKGQDCVTMADLEEARDKIRFGRQKKSKVVLEEDRRVTAYHEAGHALVAHLLPGAEPLHKVTIIPRGLSLGATMQLPEHDRYNYRRGQLLDEACVIYGGRAAEELFCGDVTTGAREDIKRVTELLRRVVCEFGMSEELGPLSYVDTEEHLFLGREIAKTRNHSEKISEEIDNAVRRLAEHCYNRTKNLLKEHRQALHEIANALLKKEVLSGEDVAQIVNEAKKAGEQKEPQSYERDQKEDARRT